MLLADFVERAGRAGVVTMIKMDGPRPGKKWTVRLNKPPQAGERWNSGGDFATLDKGLACARKSLAGLPGDWSWLDEPISDADAYAEVFEEIGETGELFIVQYTRESRWVLFAGKYRREGCATLDECVLDGLSKLGW
jgi:hypothetical protein